VENCYVATFQKKKKQVPFAFRLFRGFPFLRPPFFWDYEIKNNKKKAVNT